MAKKLKMMVILLCAIVLPASLLFVGCKKGGGDVEPEPENVVCNLSYDSAFAYLRNENNATDVDLTLENKESRTYDVYLKNTYKVDTLKIKVDGADVDWVMDTITNANIVESGFSKVGKVTLGNYVENKAITFVADQKQIKINFAWAANISASDKNRAGNDFQFVNIPNSMTLLSRINNGVRTDYSFYYEDFINADASIYLRCSQTMGYYGSDTSCNLKLFEGEKELVYDMENNYYKYSFKTANDVYATEYNVVVNPTKLTRPSGYNIENESGKIMTIGSNKISLDELNDSSTEYVPITFTFNIPEGTSLERASLYCYDTLIDDNQVTKVGNVWTFNLSKTALPYDYLRTTANEGEENFEIDYANFSMLTFKFRVEGIQFGNSSNVSSVRASVLGSGKATVTEVQESDSMHLYYDGTTAYVEKAVVGDETKQYFYKYSYEVSNWSSKCGIIIANNNKTIEEGRRQELMFNDLSAFVAVENETGTYKAVVHDVEITIHVNGELVAENITKITFKTPVTTEVYSYTIFLLNY